ncbi:MAG: dodecin family protein [Actinobacteria bacterium]|nr:dodecin family protein [Actinomycetota bacterium]
MASIARVTELSARSEQSFEDAIERGIQRAQRTLRNVRSAWVKEQRVEVGDNGIAGYQVNMLVTFELEE